MFVKFLPKSWKVLSLISILLIIAQPSQAQQTFIQNEAQAELGSPAMGPSAASVDSKGNQYTNVIDPSSGETQSVIPVSNATDLNGVGVANVGYALIANDNAEAGSTATVINATAHSARVGDTITFTSGASANVGAWSPVSAVTANTITIANAAPTTVGTGDGFRISRPQLIGSSYSANYPAMSVFLDSSSQPVVATGILKLEDSASADADAGVAVYGIRKDTGGSTTGANGDYTQISVNAAGAIYPDINSDFRTSAAKSVVKIEDEASATGDALVGVGFLVNGNRTTQAAEGDYALPAIDTAGGLFLANGTNGLLGNTGGSIAGSGVAGAKILGQASDPLALGSGVGNEDATTIRTDLLGRTITTLAPAGETWYSCTAQIGSATTTVLKAAVPSNRIYVTQFSCANNSTTPQQVYLADGAANMHWMSFPSNAVSPGFNSTFPIPLRGTSNTALNVVTSQAANTFCCASGYISVN